MLVPQAPDEVPCAPATLLKTLPPLHFQILEISINLSGMFPQGKVNACMSTHNNFISIFLKSVNPPYNFRIHASKFSPDSELVGKPFKLRVGKPSVFWTSNSKR